MIIFDGYGFAAAREPELAQRVSQCIAEGIKPHIAAILFTEDAGSRLYTRLKSEAASRVGIGYSVFSFSMSDPLREVLLKIQELNNDPQITGIIIQKPWRLRWMEVTGKSSDDFSSWWHEQVTALDLKKDVDGLHPMTLEAIKDGSWRRQKMVLPATAKAVLDILSVAGISPEATYTILGKSDILGQPLYYELRNQGRNVEMIGSKELSGRIEHGIKLTDRDVIISATGRNKLITGDLLAPGTTVIDVGEPKPDVDFESVSQVASFITPVPGGVGPVTVVSLLQNAVDLL